MAVRPSIARVAAERWSTLRRALADRDLARLLVAAASWYATDVTSLLVASVMAFELGGPAAVGLVAAMRVLPATALGGLGALTDRFSRPRIVAGVNAGFALVAAALAALAATGGSVAVLAGIVAVGSALSVLLKPNLSAMLPQLVRRPQDLAVASSAYGTATSVGSVLGPALGGTLLAAHGAAPVWLAMVGVYAATAAVAAYIRTPFQPARRTWTGPRRPAVWAVPLRGLSEFSSPGARVLVALFMMQRTMLGLVNVFVVLYAHELSSSDGDRLSGGFFTVLGVGGLLGSLASFAAAGRHARLWFATGIALWGLPVAALGATGGEAAGWIAFTLVGMGNALAGIFGYSFMSRLLAEHVAGRAWGAFNSVGSIATAVGSLGAPVLAHLLGLSGAMVLTGLVVGLSPLLSAAGLRALEASTTPRPADVDLLARVGVLAPLPRLTLERLACASQRRDVAAAVPVVEEQAAGEEFFVVESGELAVSREGADVRRLGPGDSFGEVALLRAVPRTATVVTTAPSVLLCLSRDVFVATVTGHVPTDATAEGSVSELLDADAATQPPTGVSAGLSRRPTSSRTRSRPRRGRSRTPSRVRSRS